MRNDLLVVTLLLLPYLVIVPALFLAERCAAKSDAVRRAVLIAAGEAVIVTDLWNGPPPTSARGTQEARSSCG